MTLDNQTWLLFLLRIPETNSKSNKVTTQAKTFTVVKRKSTRAAKTIERTKTTSSYPTETQILIQIIPHKYLV